MGKILNKIYNQIIEVENYSLPYLKCIGLCIHGLKHLRYTAFISGCMANILNQDIKSAIVAGYLHDCARVNDKDDCNHAHNSAELAMKITNKYWKNLNHIKIYETINEHSNGQITCDIFKSIIWDADRLSLFRVGTIPRKKFMSTQYAKDYCDSYIEENPLYNNLEKKINYLYNKPFDKSVIYIGIWLTRKSILLLNVIINHLDQLGYNLSNIKIVSFYEFKGLSKTHDRSCSYQIYSYLSNRIKLSQIISPESMSESDKNNINEQGYLSVIGVEEEHLPLPMIQEGIDNSEYQTIDFEIQNNIVRYFENKKGVPEMIRAIPLNNVNPQNSIIISSSNKRVDGKNIVQLTEIHELFENIPYPFNL